MRTIPVDRVLFLSTTIEEIQKNIQKIKADCFRSIGLGSTDLMCLWVLGNYPDGLTATELSRKCCVDKSLISRAAKKLAAVGAVFYDEPKRRECAVSGASARSHRHRNYRIRLKLTGSGDDMSRRLLGVAADAADAAKDGIASSEIDELCQTLARLNENLKGYVQKNAKISKSPAVLKNGN